MAVSAPDPSNPPTTEPDEIRIDDTWQWTREDLSDYPASTYTLTYYFKTASSNFSIIATPDNDVYDIEVLPAVNTGYTAGTYSWVAYCEEGANRFEVDRGSMEVLASFVNVNDYDDRSHNKICLDAVEAVLEGRATKSHLQTSINGRSVSHMTHAELISTRNHYLSGYNSEINKPGTSAIRVRFTKPS